MNNSINVIQSLFSNLTPPLSISVDMEILCQGFEKIFAGQPAEMSVFSQHLANVLEWSKARSSVEDASTTTGWHAQYAGLPALGGTLTCQNDTWELMLSFDANQTPYMGSWRSLSPGEEDHGCLFSIENASSGQILVLDTGQSKQQVQLTGSERIAWGSISAFLKNMQNVESVQPDTQASTPTPAPIQTGNPDVTLSSNDAPTILAKSTKQKNASGIPPTEISNKQPLPTEQPTQSQPDLWQCTCGNTNIGPVCLKCGKEKPATSPVEDSEEPQPTICKVCGKEISIGAKFCRYCGSEVVG